MFLGDLANSQLDSQFTELVSPKWFCQYISQLLFSADMINVHLPIADAITKEMKSNIYVLTPFMKDRILTECYR